MNSYQLGKVGITLLATWLVIASTLAGAEAIQSSLADFDFSEAAWVDLGLRAGGALLVIVLFGLVPAAFLIRRRRVLARRWCASSDLDEEQQVEQADVLRIGLWLIGVVTLIGGLLALPAGLGSGLVAGLWWLRGAEASPDLVAGAIASLGRGALGVLIGAWLLRSAARIAERWETRKREV